MKSIDMIEKINTKEDFIAFMYKFIAEYHENNSEWENLDIESFLSALVGFVNDSNENSLMPIEMTPSWKLFAKILTSASNYE